MCVRCYPPTCSCTDTSRLQQMMPQARLTMRTDKLTIAYQAALHLAANLIWTAA